jgi:hypothetical protein
MSFETAANQFSVTISDSTGAVIADQSTRHLWNRFRSRFRKREWLSFHSQFLSQQGLGALTNPNVTFETCFVDDFPGATYSVYVDFF